MTISNTLKNALRIGTLGLALGAASSARAEAPIDADNACPKSGVTELRVDRYYQPVEIERPRCGDASSRTFSAMASQPIQEGAVMVFEIRSVGKSSSMLRWRCVATDDVTDCLGEPVKIGYLEGDQKLVMRIWAETDRPSEGLSLAARNL